MKKIMLLIMLLTILTGCGRLAPIAKEQVKAPGIHEGRKGLTLEFMQNAPPSEVYEDSPFNIIIRTQNQGAYDVQGGMLVIGYEEQNVGIAGESDSRIDLEGKSIFNPEGTFEMETFRARAKKLGPAVAKSYTSTITATACYPYKTEATSLVCIDTDLLGVVKDKPCTLRSLSYSGQGAPVAVTTVIPKMMPHEDPEYITPEFTITIENPGQGDVIAKEKIYDACTGKKMGREFWNVINLKASISGSYLECRPSTIKIKAGGSKAVCTLKEGIPKAKGTYTAPLSIELDYGYMTRIIKSTTITKPEV